MENIYNICFYGGLTLAIILLIVSIVLFFVFRIPKVIGDLTGSTARREIEQKKKKKGRVGDTDSASNISKAEQKKYYNQGTGKITIRDSATNDDIDNDPLSGAADSESETVVLGADSEAETAVLSSAEDEAETAVLSSGGDIGDDSPTDVLTSDVDRAGAAEGDDSPTDVLTSDGDVGDDSPTDVLTSDGIGDDSPTDVLTSDGVGDDSPMDVLTSDDIGDDSPTDILRDEEEEATTILAAQADNNISTHDERYIYNIVVVNTDESL